jgi:alpha-galactosidase
MNFLKAVLLTMVFFLISISSFSQDNQASGNIKQKGMLLTGELAPTPPMGFNTWNTFQTKIDEGMLREMVDVFVSSGMRDAGYKYFVLDDGWMAMERDASGSLIADPIKFPHGMKAFADYVHANGLKFGIYNCAGTKTCAGYPGTRGHEYEDARLYASWGVDFLKYDWCNTDSLNAPEAYKTMSAALRATGRPIVFSICEWGDHNPWLWARGVGELYRTTGDIGASFIIPKSFGNWTPNTVMGIVDKQMAIRQYNGPNHWNDPDMLEVGNGMTYEEDKSHFSLWCMLAAPLSAGNDLRKMSASTRGILTNKDLIAVDQDSLGVAAFKLMLPDSLELYVKPMKDGNFVLCFLNRTANSRKINLDWKDLIISDQQSGMDIHFASQTFKYHDLWQPQMNGSTNKKLIREIPAHAVVVLRLDQVK